MNHSVDLWIDCSVSIFDEAYNSTFTIGICKNMMPHNSGENAGAIETTADNRTIIVGRYNESELVSGSKYSNI